MENKSTSESGVYVCQRKRKNRADIGITFPGALRIISGGYWPTLNCSQMKESGQLSVSAKMRTLLCWSREIIRPLENSSAIRDMSVIKGKLNLNEGTGIWGSCAYKLKIKFMHSLKYKIHSRIFWPSRITISIYFISSITIHNFQRFRLIDLYYKSVHFQHGISVTGL